MTELRSYPDAASSFARASLLAYLFLIIYASCYPFSGWHDAGVAAFSYLLAPFPRYWTWFDLTTNIIGYIPFGLLSIFALSPSIKGKRAVLLAIIFGTALSVLLEAVQTFLPSRVSSNLDLLANAAGACIGAFAGHFLRPSFFDDGRFHRLSQRWFRQESSRALIVLALWPLAQIYPQAYLFGHGEITPILSEWLSRLFGMPLDLADMVRGGMRLTVEQYWLAEIIITACGLTGAILILLCMVRRSAPKTMLALLMAICALFVKSFSSALLFTPDNAFTWLTPGALGGIFFGALMLYGLAFAPAIAQRRMAVLMLMINLTVVNIVPANHYFVLTLQAWAQGKFMNFNGAAHFVLLFWPLLALWFLFQPIHHPKNE
jgi:VanZ family protein